MGNRQRLCKLCLRTCENFQVIEASTTDMLDMLRLKISLPAREESLMCINCAETLRNSFDFLTMCNDTHRCIISFLDNKESAKVDLKQVCLSKKENVFDIPEDHVVCGICIGLVKSCSAISLEYEIEKVMLERCFPELDLSMIEQPIICAPCHDSLTSSYHFLKSSSSAEEKIQEYCEAKSMNSKDLIELTSVQEYTSKNTVKSEECNNIFGTIKVETLCEDDVKHYDGGLVEVEEQKWNNLGEVTSNNTLICKEEHDKYDIEEPISVEKDNEFKHENVNLKELEDPKCSIKEDGSLMEVQDQKSNSVQHFPSGLEDTNFVNEDIKIKIEQKNFDSFQGTDEYKICDNPMEMTVIISETRPNKYMEPDTLIHKRVSQETMFKCVLCSYEAEQECDLKVHLVTHTRPAEVFKCEVCFYETIYKHHLQRHLLRHNNSSNVNMLKCEMCSFETKYKISLETHLLTHKKFSEVNVVKCEICSLEIKRCSLRNHLLTHKNSSEVRMFNCTMCSFETKYKKGLNRHVLTHAEVNKFECEMCPYKAKRKADIKLHNLIHKSIKEVTMFKCAMCPYEAKQKGNLRQHILTHKSNKEVHFFKCEICLHQTKSKNNLKAHLLTHKSPSEITMYKCEMCPYISKKKCDVKRHSVIHKSSSEVTMFKCERCTYETKHKGSIKRHVLTHKGHA